MKPADRRQSPRVPVTLELSYFSEGQLARDLVTDLSEGGLFVRTRKPLPIGTEVALQLELPSGVTRLHGRVVWLRNAAEDGMGIAFVGEVPPTIRALLHRRDESA
jgi:type IV pilus assembly protein PilZ